MTGQVLHHPRLAWDAARVFVRAAEAGDAFGWLGERLAELLGDDYRQALVESWNRLWWSERPDVREDPGDGFILLNHARHSMPQRNHARQISRRNVLSRSGSTSSTC